MLPDPNGQKLLKAEARAEFYLSVPWRLGGALKLFEPGERFLITREFKETLERLSPGTLAMIEFHGEASDEDVLTWRGSEKWEGLFNG